MTNEVVKQYTFESLFEETKDNKKPPNAATLEIRNDALTKVEELANVEIVIVEEGPSREARIARRHDELIGVITHYKELAEGYWKYPWSTQAVDYYGQCLDIMRSLYALLALLSESAREELEVLRLKVRKEIIMQEHKMRKLHDRLEVTRGDRLLDEFFSESCRHLRLCDQYDLLCEVLTNDRGRVSKDSRLEIDISAD